MCKICSKLTTMTLERRQWGRTGVFIVNFEHITQEHDFDFEQVQIPLSQFAKLRTFSSSRFTRFTCLCVSAPSCLGLCTTYLDA